MLIRLGGVCAIATGLLLPLAGVEAFLEDLSYADGGLAPANSWWWLVPAAALATALGSTALAITIRAFRDPWSLVATAVAWLGLAASVRLFLGEQTDRSIGLDGFGVVFGDLVASTLVGIAFVRAGRGFGWYLVSLPVTAAFLLPLMVGWSLAGIALVRRPDAPFGHPSSAIARQPSPVRSPPSTPDWRSRSSVGAEDLGGRSRRGAVRRRARMPIGRPLDVPATKAQRIESASPVPSSPRPWGRGISLEGRTAPRLYAFGWLGTIAGLGALLVAFLPWAGPTRAVLALIGLASVGVGLAAAANAQARDRRAKPLPGFRGPSPFLVVAASVPLVILATVVVLLPLEAAGFPQRAPITTLLAVVVTAMVNIGLTRLLVVRTGSLRWSEMGVRPPPPDVIGDLTLGALLGLGFAFITGVLGIVLGQVLAKPPQDVPVSHGFVEGLILLVAAVIVAPLNEEIFFRGYVTTAFSRTSSATRAIVLGGALFALVHVSPTGGGNLGQVSQQALFAFLVRIPVALALGWIFLRRRSLYASVALHASYNGLPLLLVLISGR